MHACKLKSAFMRPIWYSMRKKQVYHTKIIISSVSVTVWALFQPSPALPSWAPCRKLTQSQWCAGLSSEIRAGSSSIHIQVIKPKSGLIGKAASPNKDQYRIERFGLEDGWDNRVSEWLATFPQKTNMKLETDACCNGMRISHPPNRCWKFFHFLWWECL